MEQKAEKVATGPWNEVPVTRKDGEVAVRTKKVTITHSPAPRKRKKENVLMLLQDATTGKVIKTVQAANLVTDDGLTYYAQQGANETPTYTFYAGKLALASSYLQAEGATRTFSDLTFSTFTGVQSFDSGYPKTNDDDSDNSSAGVKVLTYRRTYTTSQANFTIKALAVCRDSYTLDTSVANDSLRKVLNYLTLSTAQQVTKTSSQTLKVFVNHSFSAS